MTGKREDTRIRARLALNRLPQESGGPGLASPELPHPDLPPLDPPELMAKKIPKEIEGGELL